ncbi:hypothetical protein [Streptomyces sp. E-08]|uniref:hypothetical protein n=1 Tax=Streptomyces sp. E-08 TaxID=3404047 RepID=UPI003CEE112C
MADYAFFTGIAALTTVLLGLAATFYRWKDPVKPPFRTIREIFLPVFLPLALTWAAWNLVLLV